MIVPRHVVDAPSPMLAFHSLGVGLLILGWNFLPLLILLLLRLIEARLLALELSTTSSSPILAGLGLVLWYLARYGQPSLESGDLHAHSDDLLVCYGLGPPRLQGTKSTVCLGSRNKPCAAHGSLLKNDLDKKSY